jgi:fibronectin type 3 domain-containing protein
LSPVATATGDPLRIRALFPKTCNMTSAVSVGSHSTDLSWNPSHIPLIGYNVYRGGKKDRPYAQINSVLNASTNYTDSTVNAGTTYYYVVTGVNAEDQGSSYSNEVKVVIPSP